MKKVKYHLYVGLMMILSLGIFLNSCKKDDPEPIKAEILTFAVTNAGIDANIKAEGVITGLNIAVEVPFETDVTALQIELTTSPNATATPASGATLDFTNPRNFVVINGDVQNTYIVTVTKAAPTGPVLISMDVKSADAEEPYDVAINLKTKEVTITYNELQSSSVVLSNVVVGPTGAIYTTSTGSDNLDLEVANTTITVSYGGNDNVYTIVPDVTEAGFDPGSVSVLYDKSAASGLVPSVISDNLSRGAAFNGRYVVVPARQSGNHVYVWDIEATITEPFELSLGDPLVVTGGDWAVSDAQFVGNAIYVSNMVMNGEAKTFKIYKWDNVSDATPEVILTYTTTTNTERLGDAISIVGDPATNGYIFASNFPGFGGKVASEVYVWTFTNGVSSGPVVWDLLITVGAKLGQYGRVHEIYDMPGYFVVSGAEAGITVINSSGQVIYEVPVNLIQGRAMDPHIWTYNGGRYLSYTVNREWEANGAFYQIVNISGGANSLEGLQLLSDVNITERKVYTKNFSSGTDGWVSAVNGVAFDASGDPMIFAFTTLNGFIVEGFTK
jgi:hypothetical protein